MNINELFDNRVPKKRVKNPRTYDVRVTLNKNGDSFGIRFGFLNDAVKAFEGKAFIQFSRVDKLPDKIYFRLFDSKENLDAHKLCSNSGSKTSNLYARLTPTDETEKIYRMKWVGKTFKIKYDDKNQLYYIEQEAN